MCASWPTWPTCGRLSACWLRDNRRLRFWRQAWRQAWRCGKWRILSSATLGRWNFSTAPTWSRFVGVMDGIVRGVVSSNPSAMRCHVTHIQSYNDVKEEKQRPTIETFAVRWRWRRWLECCWRSRSSKRPRVGYGSVYPSMRKLWHLTWWLLSHQCYTPGVR